MNGEAFLKCKAVDIPVNQIGGICLASSGDHWAQIGCDGLPATAQYVGSKYNTAKDEIRLFFFDEAFPTSEDAESIPVLSPPKIQAAERSK